MTLDNYHVQATRVQLLPDDVINQIAAGELVERPASVIKELVENSIDAGSEEILVNITQGGTSSIEVVDIGNGMTKSNALMAIERFATSKVRNIDDVLNVTSLGFRGEALPSIASVSKFVLRTRTEAEEIGTEIEIHGGKIKSVSSCNCPKGTRIEVGRLFFNVPARRKFLRSPNTETMAAKICIQDIALSRPDISFKLIADNITLVNLPRASCFMERAQDIFGHSGFRNFYSEINGHLKGYLYLSEPTAAASRASALRLLVNGRSVRDKLLLASVREGYGNYLKGGQYPTGVVSIEISPKEVDVNVHPQKSEVRFRDSQGVFYSVSKAVSELFGVQHQEIKIDSAWKSFPSRDAVNREFSFYSPAQNTDNQVFSLPFDLEQAASPSMALQVNSPLQRVVTPRNELLSQMRFVGQIFKCYLLFEGEDVFALMDMHAAHERITHDKISSSLASSGMLDSQLLLTPEIIECSSLEKTRVIIEELPKYGFVLDDLGPNTFSVAGVPLLLSGTNYREMIIDIVLDDEWSSPTTSVQRRMDALISRLACHSSIRSGKEVGRDEAFELVRQLERISEYREGTLDGTCPHGRPTVKFFSKNEIEKWFGRVM